MQPDAARGRRRDAGDDEVALRLLRQLREGRRPRADPQALQLTERRPCPPASSPGLRRARERSSRTRAGRRCARRGQQSASRQPGEPREGGAAGARAASRRWSVASRPADRRSTVSSRSARQVAGERQVAGDGARDLAAALALVGRAGVRQRVPVVERVQDLQADRVGDARDADRARRRRGRSAATRASRVQTEPPGDPDTPTAAFRRTAPVLGEVLDHRDAPIIERKLPAVEVVEQRAVGDLGAHDQAAEVEQRQRARRERLLDPLAIAQAPATPASPRR